MGVKGWKGLENRIRNGYGQDFDQITKSPVR